MKGYLHKRGGNNITGVKWQKRWVYFEKEGNQWVLKYSSKPVPSSVFSPVSSHCVLKGATEKASLYIQKCRCEPVPLNCIHKSNCFSVRPTTVHKRKEYYFVADHEDDMLAWVATVNKAADNPLTLPGLSSYLS